MALPTPKPKYLPTTGKDTNFYCGQTPSEREHRHAGKQMFVSNPPVDQLSPKRPRDAVIDSESTKIASKEDAFQRLMSDSDAPYRGKRMYGEGAHGNTANLFVKYGGQGPDPPRPYGHVRNPSDRFLESLVHRGHEEAKQQQAERIAETPSAFDKQFQNGELMGFYRLQQNPAAERYDMRKQSKGFIGGLVERGEQGRHNGKRVMRNEQGVRSPDPTPIPGFNGVGVGQEDHFDRIKPAEKKDMMPPMQSNFGTKHDLKYGTHGFTKCPPAPPQEERHGWFNWTEDRQKCPVTDAGFDPLGLKDSFCSPGDPLNHPQRLKRIDTGTPPAQYLLRNEASKVPGEKPRTVKMFPVAADKEGAVPGFKSMGDAVREAANDRPRGMRKVVPVYTESRRARSSMDMPY